MEKASARERILEKALRDALGQGPPVISAPRFFAPFDPPPCGTTVNRRRRARP